MHRNTGPVRLYDVLRWIALAVVFAAIPSWAQPPKIGEINFYGLRKISREKVLTTLGIHSGDTLPPSKGDLEEKLAELPGVVDAHVEAVCCQGSRAALFIGIEERGDSHFNTRGDPAGSAVLPDELVSQFHDYLSALARGETDEARRLENILAAFAAAEPALVRDVLRNSSEPEHRAAAAAIVAFSANQTAALSDLQYALQDPEETVRAGAVRSIKALAIQSRKGGGAGSKIEPVWLVEMLHSVALGDRMLAAQTLVVLTDQPNPSALDLLRDRALPELSDMARWSTLEYALPAFLLLGRTAGIPEAELQDRWSKGDRDTVIRKAVRR